MAIDLNATHHNIPKQKVPNSQKTEKWGKECVQAYIGLSDIGGFGSSRGDVQQLYDFYNGHISEDDYHYVLKPYGKARSNFPSKLRNYPIIKPVIDLLLGEKSKRPLNYTVSVANADTITQKEEQKKQKIMQVMQQRFVNQLNGMGQETGSPTQETELPKHIVEMFDNSYVDQRAIIGQNSISYLMYKENIYDKFQKLWFHFLVSGEAYSHRGVRNNEPFYDVVNPLDVDYDKDPDVELIEDGDWALVRKDAHVSTILDNFREYLTEAQLDQLESPEVFDEGSFLVHSVNPSTDRMRGGRSRLIEVVTVYWKSISRVGFMSYPDPTTGDIETIEVPDGYKLPALLKKEGAVIDWGWIPEVWEGTRIGEKIFCKVGKLQNQRRSIDNPSVCKLPVNGIKYSEVNSDNISLVKLGLPYQVNYNIYKYRLEVAIAKSKDIIAQFDINMIPKKWDMDKFMYYIDATGIAWVDYNKEGMVLNPQHQTVMDLSIRTIEQYIVLLDSILGEWERLSGVNRQRQGAIGQYEGKGTAQQAIMQSSHITEDYFRKISMLEKSDLQALLDYSKIAWVDGKKTSFIQPDGAVEFLTVDPLKHMESEYGIFVTDAGSDIEKKQKVEMLAQSMIQNGVPASIVAEAIDSDSFTQIKDKIAKAEAMRQQLEQAQQEAQNNIAQQQNELAKQKMEYDSDQREKDRMVQIEVAMINAEANDVEGRMKIALEAAEIQRKSAADAEDSKLKREKITADLKMNTQDNAADIKMNDDDNRVEEKKIKAMIKSKQNNGPKQ